AEREKVYRAFLKAEAKGDMAGKVAMELLRIEVKKDDVKEEDLRGLAKQAADAADKAPPPLKRKALIDIAGQLVQSKAGAALALDYARQAQKMLEDTETPAVRVPVLQTLAKVLKKAGKDDEAKELTAQVDRINETLDKEYQKTALPFKPEAFAGRKAKSD